MAKYCIFCGKKITTENAKKFCSNAHQHEYIFQQYIKDWKEGKVSGNKGTYQISNHVRRYMLEKANNKCERCGWGEINPYTGRVPLEIHHIDGNYAHTTEDNLVVLCPNCHALTDTYKNVKESMGRPGRQKYYHHANPELNNN